MSEQPQYNRRRFLSAAAVTIATGPLFMIGAADAKAVKAKSADGPHLN